MFTFFKSRKRLRALELENKELSGQVAELSLQLDLLNDNIEDKHIPKNLKRYQYKKKANDSILTANEQDFLTILKSLPLIQNLNLHINIKPTLKELADVSVEENEDPDTFRANFSRISQKHFDFVLLESNTYRPVLVIELDDSGHDFKEVFSKTNISDGFKNMFCSTIGLPIVRYRKGWSVEQLNTNLMFSLLGNEHKPCPKCKTGILILKFKKDTRNEKPEMFFGCSGFDPLAEDRGCGGYLAYESITKLLFDALPPFQKRCPVCNTGTLILKSGKNDDQPWLGCSNYHTENCRGKKTSEELQELFLQQHIF